MQTKNEPKTPRSMKRTPPQKEKGGRGGWLEFRTRIGLEREQLYASTRKSRTIESERRSANWNTRRREETLRKGRAAIKFGKLYQRKDCVLVPKIRAKVGSLFHHPHG